MATTTTPKAQEIGARIAQARREAGGMSQQELGDLIHPRVSVRSIQAYEAGDTIPYRYLRELERVLGRPAAWFLHGDAAVRGTEVVMREVLERLALIEQKLDEALAKR